MRPSVFSVDEVAYGVLGQAALAGDPGDLLVGVLGADVRVEPGAAGQQGVGRDLVGVGAVELRRRPAAAPRSPRSGPGSRGRGWRQRTRAGRSRHRPRTDGSGSTPACRRRTGRSARSRRPCRPSRRWTRRRGRETRPGRSRSSPAGRRARGPRSSRSASAGLPTAACGGLDEGVDMRVAFQPMPGIWDTSRSMSLMPMNGATMPPRP